MILCHDLKISIKLLDSFHHYLPSKHLEFKFTSFCCYLLLLECIIISFSFFFFMALEDLEFAILVLVTLTASLLPDFKNIPHHSEEMKPFSFQNRVDWFPQWKVSVKILIVLGSICLFSSYVSDNSLDLFYFQLHCFILCFLIVFQLNGLWVIFC